MSEVMWVWDYELKTLGSWPSTGYNGHNTPVEVVTQMDVKALRDERDRLRRALARATMALRYYAKTAISARAVEALEKMEAALTPVEGGQDE